eukprot:2775668-Lingulodinium_polyedra.AAC.1
MSREVIFSRTVRSELVALGHALPAAAPAKDWEGHLAPTARHILGVCVVRRARAHCEQDTWCQPLLVHERAMA